MILRASSGLRGIWVDMDTGKPIPKMLWGDPETGEFSALVVDGNGDTIRLQDGSEKFYIAKGRIKFVPRANARPLSLQPVRCLVTGNPIGTENRQCSCLVCKKTPAIKQRFKQLQLPLFSDRCEEKGCQRFATWMVSDEIALPPFVKGHRKFERGKIVGRRYYCDRHFQPPRLLDAKGEVIQEFEEAGGVRPQ